MWWEKSISNEYPAKTYSVCIIFFFNTISLFFLSFSLFLALFDFWWSLKASKILQVAKFDRLLRSSTSDIGRLRANEGPFPCQFFRSCIQVALLFEVIFAMLSHSLFVRRVACGALFLSSTAMEASSKDANLFFLGGSIHLFSSLNYRSNKGLVNIAISKKKRAKRRSWCVPDPGPLKRGQEHMPSFKRAGNAFHYRAHMVYSSPCADVADWSSRNMWEGTSWDGQMALRQIWPLSIAGNAKGPQRWDFPVSYLHTFQR